MGKLKTKILRADLLIIGGGAAGCYAAICAARQDPALRIVVLEKANIKRSGCLAAGVNALNAYIVPGHTVEEYLEYVRWDAEKIVRDDLIVSMAKLFNPIVADLEKLGLVILKDENGNYVSRGKRNIKINGENIKTIIAQETKRFENVSVVNHVNATELLQDKTGRVIGAVGFSVDLEVAVVVAAKATLIATGGAAGLYRPNNPGFSRHKMWYCPFNTGAGYAMGIRAGAEMTTFEMRFVAQRIKDTIAPTGTIALGVGAREVNSVGEQYAGRYGLTTSGRAYGASNEIHEGRGPCYLKTRGIPRDQEEDLYKAYLNMAPAQTLKWLESGERPSEYNVEIGGTEPYIVGGHTGSGYWVDTDRRTTLKGLYAAGDVVGGAPKKFVTGAMAEGKIAVEAALKDLKEFSLPDNEKIELLADPIVDDYSNALSEDDVSPYNVQQLEEAMQKTMDVYAGGISADYRYNAKQLRMAAEKIEIVEILAKNLCVHDMDEMLQLFELRDRLTVCRSLIAHLKERHETRWPGFGVNADYPELDLAGEYYVNSRFVDGQIDVFRRSLVKEERYEHSN